ncbi:hypothetical protein S7711_04031 [Stachybotrys chartarum IBT 7711]|uniref:pH-response regulator protein palC n=1 Tax=Stachybotrys chartarum (strain CBS 109288 / IBT 7711) TaxID=1280523 RepID=A0A084AXI7_STACB|nr:hypothetical protein S7711_04031 [Stachybotrys chartarum IBT 7711]
MPFPFVLPTTSSFTFSSCVDCASHPSLPLQASSYRGVVRDALKKHKRLPPSSQISSLSTVVSSLNGYIPYLLAVDAGLNDRILPSGDSINIHFKSPPSVEWRPTLTGEAIPGRERARVKLPSLDYEVFFVLSTLGLSSVLLARGALQPLYATGNDFMGSQERTQAITTAMKHLLEAASVWDYLATKGENNLHSPPCVDVSPAMLRALASTAHAEATLLAVLKDDPYPAAVAQDRNKGDKDWMFKAPEIPKVRANIYARLCLAASEHAAQAASLCQSTSSQAGKVDPGFLKYLEDLRKTSRAKACRLFAIDAELGGQTADGIGWLRAGLQELGFDVKGNKKGLSFSRFKKEFAEKREDRRVEKESAWGSDAGKIEETRVIEMLDAKWTKINDTVSTSFTRSALLQADTLTKMNTRPIPAPNTLLSQMPSGREIHSIKQYQPPLLDHNVLESMRVPPDAIDDLNNELSSDDETRGPSAPVGAFPGTRDDYQRSPSSVGNGYY